MSSESLSTPELRRYPLLHLCLTIFGSLLLFFFFSGKNIPKEWKIAGEISSTK